MYDHPANEFVLTFLGPATGWAASGCGRTTCSCTRRGRDASPDAVEGTVARVTHLGFEVRVDVDLANGGDCWVQLSRGNAAELKVEAGQRVWVARVDTSTSERLPMLSV